MSRDLLRSSISEEESQWKNLALDMLKFVINKTKTQEFKEKIGRLLNQESNSQPIQSSSRTTQKKKDEEPILPKLKQKILEFDVPTDYPMDISDTEKNQPELVLKHIKELSSVFQHHCKYTLFTAHHLGKYLGGFLNHCVFHSEHIPKKISLLLELN